MKNKFKIVIAFILGIVVTGSVVYASGILASNIGYKNGTVKDALDDLYSVPQAKKFCELKDGTALTVGAKYECDPGDGVKRNFFVLAVDNNKVKLIMEHNITQGSSTTTMTWNNAMKYIKNNLVSSWTDVLEVNLPSVQDIAIAVGNTGWNYEDSKSTNWFCIGGQYSQKCEKNSGSLVNDDNTIKYNWLFNYTLGCENSGCLVSTSLGEGEANGYWTENLINGDGTQAWRIYRDGAIRNYDISNNQTTGVRPVITVLKSNLYE